MFFCVRKVEQKFKSVKVKSNGFQTGFPSTPNPPPAPDQPSIL